MSSVYKFSWDDRFCYLEIDDWQKKCITTVIYFIKEISYRTGWKNSQQKIVFDERIFLINLYVFFFVTYVFNLVIFFYSLMFENEIFLNCVHLFKGCS